MQRAIDIGDFTETANGVCWLELQVANGPLKGLRGTSDSTGRLLVGRAQNCQLQIVDRRMSREHFLAECSEGCWRIRDLASSNGTFVNERRIAHVTDIRTGDLLTAGDTLFAVTIGEAVLERLDSDQVPGEKDTAPMAKAKSTHNWATNWFEKRPT